MSEPVAKRGGQRDKILVWLQMRGERGVLNTELNEICLRYGARLHELRQAGHNIKTIKLDDSRYRFVLNDYFHCNYCDFKGTGVQVTNHLLREHEPRKAVQERLFA